MKYLFLILGVLGVVGTIFGIAVSNGVSSKPMVRTGQEKEAERLVQLVKTTAEKRRQLGDKADIPKALCPQATYSFGLMDPLTVGKHVFSIENQGNVPLVLEGGESSCKCTLSDLEQAIVEPGDSYQVKLTWNSGHSRREFNQSAMVRTNDPLNPEIQLSVTGQVRAVLSAQPPQLNLDRLLPSTQKSMQFAVYSQVWENFTIDRIESSSEYISGSAIGDKLDTAYAIDDEIKNSTAVEGVAVTYNGKATAGQVSGVLRVFMKPPASWEDTHSGDASDATNAGKVELPKISYPLQDDGTVLLELPFYGEVVKPLGLYGKQVMSSGLIELGKLKSVQTKGKKWNILGRIRGENRPTSISATAKGIPGLVATVQSRSSNKAKSSFSINLELTEALEPAIYDGDQQGLLVIETPGLAGSELLELPINLDVLAE